MRVFEHVVVETRATVRLDIREDGSMRIEVDSLGAQRLTIEVEQLDRLELVE